MKLRTLSRLDRLEQRVVARMPRTVKDNRFAFFVMQNPEFCPLIERLAAGGTGDEPDVAPLAAELERRWAAEVASWSAVAAVGSAA